MKLNEFLERIPEPFAVELLEALPGPDRKDLLRQHGAKVKITAGNLKRANRMAKECRLLVAALKKTDDLDAKRTFLQGWLARRAELIVHFLNTWEVEHTNGIVEDFGWVNELDPEVVKKSVEALDEKFEKHAPLVYFTYLELPCTNEVLDVDALFKGLEEPQSV